MACEQGEDERGHGGSGRAGVGCTRRENAGRCLEADARPRTLSRTREGVRGCSPGCTQLQTPGLICSATSLPRAELVTAGFVTLQPQGLRVTKGWTPSHGRLHTGAGEAPVSRWTRAAPRENEGLRRARRCLVSRDPRGRTGRVDRSPPGDELAGTAGTDGPRERPPASRVLGNCSQTRPLRADVRRNGPRHPRPTGRTTGRMGTTVWRQSRTAGTGCVCLGVTQHFRRRLRPFTWQDPCSTGPTPETPCAWQAPQRRCTDLWPCDRSTSDLSIAMRVVPSWFSLSRLRCSVSSSRSRASTSRRRERICSSSCGGRSASAVKPTSRRSFPPTRVVPLRAATAADRRGGSRR